MKSFKFIGIFLLFLLPLVGGAEMVKTPVQLTICQEQENFLASEVPQYSSSALVTPKDLDIHFIVKKKIKHRATTSDSSTLKTPYFTKLVHFKIFENGLIYGIATIYQIQRHTHLHLYQLF
ncbi:hypothetical protein ACHRVW_12745 [Flavobacterium collinsii]|jgi:hypothetical protein|uniref:Uncharacterized protein n=1 Tax=Flavobacterium collinsii TaxID=1114861 RepID=A0A9W4X4K6_9FLAO|nr:hypothetical protein [Flavobacterium collinsii]GIQ59520.1 hypothetical protein Flavo103_26560 [Flavobacterium collinsii]CAA9198664.1 hypothetical protein FLACOL7796_02261 [Flavobacterium collinsii]CAI2768251.1 conserved protein of unknown function [Flavobacterium collinsii]